LFCVKLQKINTLAFNSNLVGIVYLQMPKKALLVYSIICVAVILLLDVGKFSVYAGLLKLEIYLAIAGLSFMSLGIYMGVQWISSESKSINNFDINFNHNSSNLSPRELDVLELMAGGLTNQEIADQLFISLPTVKTHTSNIYQKLNVKRRTQAIQVGIQSGLIQSHTKD
jgi:two-component system, NarL family, response regulator LiaR